MKIDLSEETVGCLLQAFRDSALENHYYIDNSQEANERKFSLDRALYELQYALINLREQK